MALLSSKMIAINIVDVPDGTRPIDANPIGADAATRLALLEEQVANLKQWKTSFTPMEKEFSTSTSSVASPPGSPGSSFSSVDSNELPVLDTVRTNPLETTPAEAVKKSNLPTKRGCCTNDNDVTSRIMTIIQGYGRNEENAAGDAWLGRVKFEPRVRKHVDANEPVHLVLPAFPWKSVNKVEKVLGAIPDLGEELGLGRLNNLCEDIQAIYPKGAIVTVTSDGLVYNDLLGISDAEVYEYGIGLRRMAEAKGYTHLRFIRMMNLLGMVNSPHMTKEEYLEAVGPAREMLVSKYLQPDFEAREAILNDADINMTYCGYMLFLAKDLRHSPVTEGVTGKNEYKRIVKRVAHDMITRGKAFAAVIDDMLPDHVRLSIHRSTGLNKLSFPLVPHPDHFSMTPWHCCIAVTAKGQFRTAHATELRQSYDLIYQNGQPYFFRDRSDVWKWETEVEFEFFYPRGVLVKAKTAEGEAAPKIGKAELAKLKELGKGFSPVIPIGFS